MSARLDLVLMWHMHQPDYRDYLSGEFTQPWVYLHAIKDYTDMAAHLERHPEVRAVVNLVPVLLDQLEDYSRQFEAGEVRDPLLRLLQRVDDKPLTAEERALVLERCFSANHDKMVSPYPYYVRLHQLFDVVRGQSEDALLYLSDRYYYDLLVWYHLAWTGETVRRNSELIARLLSAGQHFTLDDRRALYRLIGELIASVVPRYAALARDGRIELSTTPHFHPLAPLMLDFRSAREARPTMPLPTASHYPGGQARVRFHVDAAAASHRQRFGVEAQGLWPAEGALSAALIDVFGESGCAWTATGEAVLANSLRGGAQAAAQLPETKHDWLYRPYRLREKGPVLFFRDDRLSDLIGFEYAKWHSRDAALNFMAELDAVAEQAQVTGRVPLVSVILDGENCWEYYPYNGFYFLEALYAALEANDSIRTCTYSSVLAEGAHAAQSLDKLIAGSWVHGDFGTWIGSHDKNHAWDLLVEAKQSFDTVVDSGRLDETARAAAARQLASCESSDWFWWMGDYNPAEAVASFERLYRANLARLYTLLKLPQPHSLDKPISRGNVTQVETGGTMRRAS